MLLFYKRILGLRGQVCTQSLMDELGVAPLQSTWLKACLTFFNSARGAGGMLGKVVRANLLLGREGARGSWCFKLNAFWGKVERGQILLTDGEVDVGKAIETWERFMLTARQRRVHATPQGEEPPPPRGSQPLNLADPNLPARTRATCVSCLGPPPCTTRRGLGSHDDMLI